MSALRQVESSGFDQSFNVLPPVEAVNTLDFLMTKWGEIADFQDQLNLRITPLEAGELKDRLVQLSGTLEGAKQQIIEIANSIPTYIPASNPQTSTQVLDAPSSSNGVIFDSNGGLLPLPVYPASSSSLFMTETELNANSKRVREEFPPSSFEFSSSSTDADPAPSSSGFWPLPDYSIPTIRVETTTPTAPLVTAQSKRARTQSSSSSAPVSNSGRDNNKVTPEYLLQVFDLLEDALEPMRIRLKNIGIRNRKDMSVSGTKRALIEIKQRIGNACKTAVKNLLRLDLSKVELKANIEKVMELGKDLYDRMKVKAGSYELVINDKLGEFLLTAEMNENIIAKTDENFMTSLLDAYLRGST